MQHIQALADKRIDVERELRQKQTSFQSVKFYQTGGRHADEMEVWFKGKSSTTYREQVEVATRRVIEESFGIVLKGGAVQPSQTNSYCILYKEGIDCSVDAQQLAIAEKEAQLAEEGEIWVNGFRLQKSKRDSVWRVSKRIGTRWNLVYATLDRVGAFRWAVNYKPTQEFNYVVR